MAQERTNSVSTLKKENEAESKRDQHQQIVVVRDDHLIEHQLKPDRRGNDDGLEEQRDQQDLCGGSGKSFGVPHNLEQSDPCPLGLALEPLGRPSLQHNPGKPPPSLLQRNLASP